MPEESHGLRILVGYSPWGHKESDTIEASEHAGKYTEPSRPGFCPSGYAGNRGMRRDLKAMLA